MASHATSVRAGAGLRLLRAAVFTAVCVVLAAAGHTLAAGRAVPVEALVVGWVTVFAVAAPLAGRERSLPGIAALLTVGQFALHTVFNAGQMCGALAAPGTDSGVSSAAFSGASSGAFSGTASGTSSGGGGLTALAARLLCGDLGVGATPGSARDVVVGAGLDPSSVEAPAHLPHTGASGGAGHSAMAAMAAVPMYTLPMLLGHLLAAVVAGWLLRRGESALWRLVRLSVRGAAAISPAAAFHRAHALLSVLAARAPYAWLRVRRTAGEAAARYRTVWLRHCVARRGPPAAALAA